MEIAIVGEGTRGDVAPLVGLAAAFRERGHGVRLVARPDFRGIEPDGVAFRAYGGSIRAIARDCKGPSTVHCTTCSSNNR